MNPYATVAIAALTFVCSSRATRAAPQLAPSVTTPQAATETIVITAKTHVVHVYENDAVLFKFGARQFAIKFDGGCPSYLLSTIAPPGFTFPHKIRVFVAPNPTQHQQGIP